MPRFCSAINCLDGRVQLPVFNFLQKRFDADFVDVITEASPNRLLAMKRDSEAARSVIRRVRISVEEHLAVGISVMGHHDCAGNPSGAVRQKEEIHQAMEFLRHEFPDTPVIGLWVDDKWLVHETGVR